MSPISFPTSINSADQTLNQLTDPHPVEKASSDFSKMLDTTVKEVIASQNTGEKAIEQLNSGEAQNLHDVMIAVEQADLSLRMLVQLRNKALEAYNEIIKMNV